LTVDDLRRWGVLWCPRGRHAWRLIVPIVMDGATVQFQARSYRGAEPKYRSGEIGVDAARPMDACLFNLDAVGEGDDVILVEGWADVARRSVATRGGVAACGDDAAPGGGVPVALLGSALTEAKAALLAAKRPRSVTVALDADAVGAGYAVADGLAAYLVGTDVRMGLWRGGKDAGSGARLEASAHWRGIRR
jgi:DNA primase